jgi:hypothetical protein
MRFDFMTPEVWNGLVMGVVLVGAAFAVLRLLRDWNRYQWRKQQSDRQADDLATSGQAGSPRRKDGEE